MDEKLTNGTPEWSLGYSPYDLATSSLAAEFTHAVAREFVTSGSLSVGGVIDAIPRIHAAYMSILTAGANPVKAKAELVPAVPVKKSVTQDYIICLEDGKKFKSMRRHLSKLGMTPEQYREKWGLPSDYPIVAASYSAKRSQMAKDNGLGKKK